MDVLMIWIDECTDEWMNGRYMYYTDLEAVCKFLTLKMIDV